MSPLTTAEIARIRELLANGRATAEIAAETGQSKSVVKRISCLLGYAQRVKKDTRNANPA